MITTSASMAAFFKGLRAGFLKGHGEAITLHQDLCMELRTGAVSQMDYADLLAIPGLQELIGKPNLADLSTTMWSIPNKEYSAPITVKRASLERDQFGLYSKIAEQLGIKAKQHPDTLLAQALVAAFTTVCWTGSPFFSANHKLDKTDKKAPTFSNLGTKRLTAASYEEAVTEFLSARDSVGDPVNLGISSKNGQPAPGITLVVSNKNRVAARNILLKERASGGEDNMNYKEANLVVNPWLKDNSEEWFLLNTAGSVRAFVHQIEVPIELSRSGPENGGDEFLEQKFIYQAYGRHNVGMLSPQLAWASNGTQPG
jgi:phage major head subunit gpT-like protein